ncbi:hypothetical protein AQUCO_00500071v1 [Aquilegia coerulea]|uniref:Plant heme peroxidase family profile domain-containing protein n=1 Tax=Aquilegia coerulea TaxID=218851 RepID=A0A2G5EQ83_AQUCA|nr:hypothetical protein AQUCO_00500071v1 [Aquilegia coerulea]
MVSSKALCFFVLFSFSAIALQSAFADHEEDVGLVMNFYKDTCPQAEEIIREQVKLLYKRHKNTAFSWLRNIFHDCAVQSCDASLLLDSTRRELSEKETDRSFGLRNFRYLDTIKEAVERECPGVVSCADILVLSGRDGVVALGGPYIPLKTGRRDGRRSRAEILEQYLPDHNESISSVLDKFGAMGIDTPGVVALLGIFIHYQHIIGIKRTRHAYVIGFCMRFQMASTLIAQHHPPTTQSKVNSSNL